MASFTAGAARLNYGAGRGLGPLDEEAVVVYWRLKRRAEKENRAEERARAKRAAVTLPKLKFMGA